MSNEMAVSNNVTVTEHWFDQYKSAESFGNFDMDACFNAFDKDGDGYLNVTEFGVVCKALFRNDRGKIYCMEPKRVQENDFISGTLNISHCAARQNGAELVENSVKVYKGTNPEVDSYSVFWDNKKLTETTLVSQLQARNATDIYICGLAYDVCVGKALIFSTGCSYEHSFARTLKAAHIYYFIYVTGATAIDALAIGYRTILIDDCSRGVDLVDIEKTKKTVTSNNGVIIDSSQVKGMVEGRDRRPELGYKLALELKNALKNPEECLNKRPPENDTA
ncbi:hypothetical protein C0J52_01556 [Blattella germanica]|nr:hypothetical protein C0J52_01556 [Blattella germanica]